MRAKLPHAVTIPRKADETRAMREALRDAQRNVAAPHQQHALHHAVGVEIGPAVNAPARASRNPAQESSMTIPCADDVFEHKGADEIGRQARREAEA